MGGGPDSVRLWFCGGVGWQYGPGASGGSLGGGFLGGFGAGAATLAWMGVLVTLDAVSLVAACGAAGMPVPADVGCQPGGRTVPELVRGGVWGSGGRSASGLGLRLGLGGLGPGWCAAGAWVGACAWARLWCGGLRCIGCLRRGGPIEAG